MNRIVEPGHSAQENTIALLRDAAVELRRAARDARGMDLANRIHAFLAQFPTHFVTEFLIQRPDGGADFARVALDSWPDWAAALKADRAEVPACETDRYTRGQLMADLSEMLGTSEDPACIAEAVQELKDAAELQEEQSNAYDVNMTEAKRMLWYVIAEFVPGATVEFSMHDLKRIDWSTANLRRDQLLYEERMRYTAEPVAQQVAPVLAEYDQIALAIARQHTRDEDPQTRAELQVQVVEAMRTAAAPRRAPLIALAQDWERVAREERADVAPSIEDHSREGLAAGVRETCARELRKVVDRG